MIYSLQKANRASIEGNGNFSIVFRDICSSYQALYGEKTFELRRPYSPAHVGTNNFSISGVSFLGSIEDYARRPPGGNLTTINLDMLRVFNNTFESLALKFNQLKALHVTDDPRLRNITAGLPVQDFDWKEVVIARNPLLSFNSSWPPFRNGTPGTENDAIFYWPVKDVDTIVLHGNFSNEFL